MPLVSWSMRLFMATLLWIMTTIRLAALLVQRLTIAGSQAIQRDMWTWAKIGVECLRCCSTWQSPRYWYVWSSPVQSLFRASSSLYSSSLCSSSTSLGLVTRDRCAVEHSCSQVTLQMATCWIKVLSSSSCSFWLFQYAALSAHALP